MESWEYPNLSAVVHVALFDNVRDAKTLRSRLVAAASLPGADGEAEREAVNFAFVEASLVGYASSRDPVVRLSNYQVASQLHFQTAVLYALLALQGNTLRTKTVHSEILWALNPTNNARHPEPDQIVYYCTNLNCIFRSLRRFVDSVFPTRARGCLLPE